MKNWRRQPRGIRAVRRLVLAGLIGATVACTGPTRLEAVTLLQHGQCQGATAGVRLITYAELAQLRGTNLLSMTGGDATPAAGAGDDQDPLLIAISRGPQPTAGYSIAFESAMLDQGTARLSVRWQTPAADTVQAQVITHPCLVVALPRVAVKRVTVADQSGQTLGTLTVPEPPHTPPA